MTFIDIKKITKYNYLKNIEKLIFPEQESFKFHASLLVSYFKKVEVDLEFLKNLDTSTIDYSVNFDNGLIKFMNDNPCTKYEPKLYELYIRISWLSS